MPHSIVMVSVSVSAKNFILKTCIGVMITHDAHNHPMDIVTVGFLCLTHTTLSLVLHGQTAFFRFSLGWRKKGLVWFTVATRLGTPHCGGGC